MARTKRTQGVRKKKQPPRPTADSGGGKDSASDLRQRLDDLTRLVSDWIWETDENLRLTFVSARVFDVLGYHPYELVGRSFPELGRPNAAAGAPNPLGGRSPFRDVPVGIANRGGERRSFLVSGLPVFALRTGKFSGLRGTARDVTANERAVEMLHTALEKVETARRAKSDFLSRVSHDFRTPLNAVLGFSQLLAEDARDPLNERQKGYVGHVLAAGRHLLELIDEILDLAKIEAGTAAFSIESIRAGEAIDECLNLIQPLARERGIAVFDRTREDDLPVITADRSRLKAALLNLLSNAVKYNSGNGSVTVAAARTAAGFLRVNVTDTGAGISKADQARLFEPFVRLDGQHGRIQGTGIGLAISRRSIEMMKGRIGVESAPGKGSTFWIELPLADAVSAGAGEEKAAAESGAAPKQDRPKARTVLYVEDNLANLQLMEVILGQIAGATMLSATTAEHGLKLAEELLPDVILMDINLPGIDGFAALDRLRRSETTRAIPVIAVTADAMPERAKRAAGAGFFDYLTKPIKVDEVLAAVDRAVGKASAAASSSGRP